MTGRWTGWHPLDEQFIKREEGHGIYAIRLVAPDGTRVRVPRMGGEDPQGILYIGRSGLSRSRNKDLKNRLLEFLNNPQRSQEPLGLLESKLYDMLGRFHLEYRVMRLDDQEIEDKERQQVLKYIRRFGEPPPCNSVIAGRYG